MNQEQYILSKKHIKIGYMPSGVYFDSRLNRYVKVYRGSRSKYLKRVCNKRVRRYNEDIPSGNKYRRVTNFWNLYW